MSNPLITAFSIFHRSDAIDELIMLLREALEDDDPIRIALINEAYDFFSQRKRRRDEIEFGANKKMKRF